MSIDIIRLNESTLIARKICDVCKCTMEEHPACPGEHAGTRLLVANWCKDCAKKAGFPETTEVLLKMPHYTVRGHTFGNPNAVANMRRTPESWIATESNDCWIVAPAASDSTVVAYVGTTARSGTLARARSSKANAHLIAAAPDMLAALENFIAAGTMDCCCGETPCCGSCTITLAKNAVKKARGE